MNVSGQLYQGDRLVGEADALLYGTGGQITGWLVLVREEPLPLGWYSLLHSGGCAIRVLALSCRGNPKQSKVIEVVGAALLAEAMEQFQKHPQLSRAGAGGDTPG